MKKNDNEKFTRFTVRLLDEENQKLQLLADSKKMAKAELIRYMINNSLDDFELLLNEKQEMKKAFKEVAFQIQKIGVVLNEANRNFYQNNSIKIEDIEKELEELWQYLKVLKE